MARKTLVYAVHHAVNLLGTAETHDLVKEVLAEYAEFAESGNDEGPPLPKE